jgi:hypothetical protein
MKTLLLWEKSILTDCKTREEKQEKEKLESRIEESLKK